MKIIRRFCVKLKNFCISKVLINEQINFTPVWINWTLIQCLIKIKLLQFCETTSCLNLVIHLVEHRCFTFNILSAIWCLQAYNIRIFHYFLFVYLKFVFSAYLLRSLKKRWWSLHHKIIHVKLDFLQPMWIKS